MIAAREARHPPRGWRRWLDGLRAPAPSAPWPCRPSAFCRPSLCRLSVAVWLLDGAATGAAVSAGAPLRRRRSLGWLWGFGYFVAGLWWLGAAFLVEAEQFAWAMPFGVLGLPALLAFFPAFGFALARCSGSPGAGASSPSPSG